MCVCHDDCTLSASNSPNSARNRFRIFVFRLPHRAWRHSEVTGDNIARTAIHGHLPEGLPCAFFEFAADSNRVRVKQASRLVDRIYFIVVKHAFWQLLQLQVGSTVTNSRLKSGFSSPEMHQDLIHVTGTSVNWSVRRHPGGVNEGIEDLAGTSRNATERKSL